VWCGEDWCGVQQEEEGDGEKEWRKEVKREKEIEAQ